MKSLLVLLLLVVSIPSFANYPSLADYPPDLVASIKQYSFQITNHCKMPLTGGKFQGTVMGLGTTSGYVPPTIPINKTVTGHFLGQGAWHLLTSKFSYGTRGGYFFNPIPVIYGNTFMKLGHHFFAC